MHHYVGLDVGKGAHWACVLGAEGGVLCHERSRTYYRSKRAEGKGHTQAVIALAKRRVNVLWAMLRDGTLYEDRASLAA